MVNDKKSKYILNPLLSGLEQVRRNGKFLRQCNVSHMNRFCFQCFNHEIQVDK